MFSNFIVGIYLACQLPVYWYFILSGLMHIAARPEAQGLLTRLFGPASKCNLGKNENVYSYLDGTLYGMDYDLQASPLEVQIV